MRIVALDWSGRARGAERYIWLAEASDGELLRLECGRSREQIAVHLIDEASRTPEIAVGMDFGFALPAWQMCALGVASGPELWALAAREAEAWLAACAPPYWGRAGRPRPQLGALFACHRWPLSHFRRTEEETRRVAGVAPKSVFQVGGAGSVGSGSLRGMATLHRLHDAGFSIWPFDAGDGPRAFEIWPRLFTGPVRKTRAVERALHLERYRHIEPALLRLAASSEDAFDAAVSAIEMSLRVGELASLPSARDEREGLEGAIWGG